MQTSEYNMKSTYLTTNRFSPRIINYKGCKMVSCKKCTKIQIVPPRGGKYNIYYSQSNYTLSRKITGMSIIIHVRSTMYIYVIITETLT